jgi:hypothetical protein
MIKQKNMKIKSKLFDFILRPVVIIVTALFFAVSQKIVAQEAPTGFVEDFSSPQLTGWKVITGSGDLIANQTVTLTQQNGIGIFWIDATQDRRNIWWAVMNHEITDQIDRSMLGKPDKAIRIEAKVRLPKPRRFNMSLNYTGTTDYHADLAEFDIDDSDWHVVSYTNREFGAKPADRVFVQLAVMDAGREVITVELAYIKVTIVDAATAAPDLGNPIPYRPPLKGREDFTHSLSVREDAIIDSEYPWVNFSKWHDASIDSKPLLSISGSQTSILRWDFSDFVDKKPTGWGLFVLTTHNVQYAPSDLEEFGYMRLVEIKAGDPSWTRDKVTFESLLQGKTVAEVIHPQLVMDELPEQKKGAKTIIPVSPIVMERLFSGKTKGLAIYSQGVVNASFASSEAEDSKDRPTLYFEIE